ncbi:hypothetical protein [Kaistella jeonii]|uniref:Uncharacterized protein n=1 Tax=Kaistella jeonii TaxID=266749 RepID=A0A0C1FCC8_9FLAO|nr:hypothetical protein [Kaistella jeonii]KIA90697.1 hypothetical protein OA86_02150 [Kaistella jeonii]SFB68961.1 hypothetical protein SAMN05421876_10189 [Kaistella jeonii]VEI94692.1 Uncharacterised protein [Kaistella jeonii]
MSLQLFNPFKDLIFDEQFCFLTGDLTTEKISVFPDWLMDHFKFGGDRIEMMDKAKSYHYEDLKLPCSPRVKKAFEQLDEKIQEAYQKGFEGMASLDENLLFLWTGRIVYGHLYYEMRYERDRLLRQRENFNLSSSLRERFGNFHLMMQSIIEPVSFIGKKPWSIAVFPLKYSADIFSYRNDAINLLFQFGVNGFGFIACLQDNGIIGEKQKDILDKMKGHVLHPVQFEELYARFHYSDYLLQYRSEYKIENNDQGITMEAIPILQVANRPTFGFWDEDIFAQLLSNYWSVYGIQREDIIKFQKPPLSYLENPYSKDFIDPESIDLPF